jgi:hypothetical protein
MRNLDRLKILLYKRRICPMAGPVAQHLRDALSEKIAESLEASIPPSTPRRVPGAVDFHGKATAVVGMRRAGKTTFVHQQRARRLEAGAAQIQVPYVNFEDERLGGMKAAELAFLIEEHGRLVPDARERGTVTWCFDDVQVVSGWERFMRAFLDWLEVGGFPEAQRLDGARSPAGELALIQVCADASDPSTAEREHRALLEAMVVHSEARAYLLTLTSDAGPRTVPEGVTAMPAYAWMLGEQV